MCPVPGWCHLSASPATHTSAVEWYLTGAGIAKSSTRANEMDADTVTGNCPSRARAIGWRHRQGWIVGDPTIGIERRLAPPDRTKAPAAIRPPRRRRDRPTGRRT